jgi:hypothetical protein
MVTGYLSRFQSLFGIQKENMYYRFMSYEDFHMNDLDFLGCFGISLFFKGKIRMCKNLNNSPGFPRKILQYFLKFLFNKSGGDLHCWLSVIGIEN